MIRSDLQQSERIFETFLFFVWGNIDYIFVYKYISWNDKFLNADFQNKCRDYIIKNCGDLCNGWRTIFSLIPSRSLQRNAEKDLRLRKSRKLKTDVGLRWKKNYSLPHSTPLGYWGTAFVNTVEICYDFSPSKPDLRSYFISWICPIVLANDLIGFLRIFHENGP